MASMSAKKYDIILFGVTGFTGRLVAEYLQKTAESSSVKWAVSGRNQSKCETVLREIGVDTGGVDVLVADLVCSTPEEESKLKAIVEQTKVVLTCSGPFEKYGPSLVKICAELGVYYADITGETDYFRQTIERHDKQAQDSGAVILCHCGHDCIPCDLIVYELHQYALNKGCQLKEVMTYQEFADEATFSGGTAATAAFQLSKDRTQSKPTFDPLVSTKSGEKSEFLTKNACPKGDIDVPALPGRKAGPWIMAPVMMNCVRRSNALLGYSKDFSYGDSAIKTQSWNVWAKNITTTAAVGAAIYSPNLLGKVFAPLVPKSGEGPSRDDMEKGFLKLHATAQMISMADADSEAKVQQLEALFEFRKDTGYLYTAALLCETGLLLVEKYGSLPGGCVTPAVALGGDLTERILKNMETRLEIKQLE